MSSAPSPTDVPAPRPAARARNPLALSLGASLLLLVGLVLGNVAFARTTLRVDLTEDRTFTLSDASKRVLAGLADPAKISVFWGEKLPARAEPVRRRLEGLLEEFAASSGGKLEVVWVKMDDAGKEEASKKGIFEGTIQELGANTFSESKDYDGLSIAYESRSEKLGPLIEMSEDQQTMQLSSSIEYELATALYKLSRPKRAVVGLVRDAPPPAFMAAQGGGEDRFSILSQAVLAKVYGDDFRDALSLETPAPADVTVLVVAAPKEWSPKKTYHLEQFLLRGGKVLLLLDPVDVRGAWFGQPMAKSGLDEWLDGLGVKVTPGVVGDLDKQHMGAALTRERALIAYPFFLRALPAELDQANPATRDFPGVPFYFPGEIVADPKIQAAAGRTVTVLATTSPSGFVRKDTTGLADARRARAEAVAEGAKALLVQLDGPFTSFWKGKPSPDDKPPEPPPAVVPPAPMTPAPGTPTAPTPEPAMTEPAMDAGPAPIPDAPKAPDAPKPPDAPKGPEGDAGAAGAPGKDAGPARLDTGRGLLVVCGDAELVSDDFSGGSRDVTGGVTRAWGGVAGFSFVNNLVDWMTGSDELVALRTRGSAVRKLDEIDDSTASTAQTLNFVAAPLLVLIAGILVFVVRKYRS